MSGFLNSQTSSRTHLAVARGDRGGSRQTGWTVPGGGVGGGAQRLGHGQALQGGGGNCKPLKDLPVRPRVA